MPARKRKHEELQGGAPLKEEDGSEPKFQVVVNPPKSYALNYCSGFDSRLNVKYAVRLRGSTTVWDKLKNYKSFQTINSKVLIPVNSFVYVRGNPLAAKASTKRENGKPYVTPDDEVEYENWVAQVLECKAADTRNVFLRVVWLYWPDDLQDYGGRRDYHGDLEVIPSNDMQIINAIAVGGLVELERWDDKKDANHTSRPDCLIWRQTLDLHASGRKSALDPAPVAHCICDQPANPNRFLFHCPTCKRWMHEECIINDAISEAPNTEPQQQSSNKIPSRDKPEPFDDEVSSAGAESIAIDAPSGLFARVYDRLVQKRDAGSPAPKTSSISAPQGKLRATSQKAGKQGRIDTASPSNKSRKYANAGPASPPFPQKRDAPGKARKGKKNSKEHVEAMVKEPSSEHPDLPTTIILTKHCKDDAKKVWEQPMRCLFKGCGKQISQTSEWRR